jgi:hypothetical protein
LSSSCSDLTWAASRLWHLKNGKIQCVFQPRVAAQNPNSPRLRTMPFIRKRRNGWRRHGIPSLWPAAPKGWLGAQSAQKPDSRRLRGRDALGGKRSSDGEGVASPRSSQPPRKGELAACGRRDCPLAESGAAVAKTRHPLAQASRPEKES